MAFDLLIRAFLAVGALWLVLRWEAKRGNAVECARDLFDAALTAGALGILVGRIGAMLHAGVSPLTDPGQILLVRSGIATVPAAVTAVVTLGSFGRRHLWQTYDAVAPAAVAALSAWQGSCFVGDACLGIPSDLPWAIALSGSDVTRHPVGIYECLALAAVAFGLVVVKQTRRPPVGMASGIALAGVGVIRLAMEPMKLSIDGGPTWFYALATAVGLAVVIGSWSRAKRHGSIESGPEFVGIDGAEPRVDDDPLDDDH